jgi:prostaglandin-endoperoxide synthase 2
VWGNPHNKRLAFTDEGIKAIEASPRLRDVLKRNSTGLGSGFVGMTRKAWRRE